MVETFLGDHPSGHGKVVRNERVITKVRLFYYVQWNISWVTSVTSNQSLIRDNQTLPIKPGT